MVSNYKVYLFLGEGDFSYSYGYINEFDHVNEDVDKIHVFILTEYQDYDQIQINQIISKFEKFKDDQKLKIIFKFGFDATNSLSEDYKRILLDNKIENVGNPDEIIFNFPYYYNNPLEKEHKYNHTKDLLIGIFNQFKCWSNLNCTLNITYLLDSPYSPRYYLDSLHDLYKYSYDVKPFYYPNGYHHRSSKGDYKLLPDEIIKQYAKTYAYKISKYYFVFVYLFLF